MGLKDIFKRKEKNEDLKNEIENKIDESEENAGNESEKEINDAAEETEQNSVQEEVKSFVKERMNDADFQIRFLVEHKVLPAKLNDDPVYIITSLIADKGAYINNFYNGIYAQNKLENPYSNNDFGVSDPFDVNDVKGIRIDMPEKNMSKALCKSVYIVYNEKYTKYLYLMVQAENDDKYKLGSWIDGEYEEYEIEDENITDKIAEIARDEEITREKYTDIVERLFDREVTPAGVFTDPQEIQKHGQIYMNALMQVQKFKEDDKRDEALKLIKDVIRKEAANYVDTEDKEYHAFRNAFEVLLYVNHAHPYNYDKKTKKQVEGMQIDLSSAYLVYGAMMLEKQQYDKAIDILWKAVEANPVNVQMIFALADAYKGKRYLKTYLNLMKRAHVYAVRKVDIARIYRNYAYYYTQIKNYDLAAVLVYASKYFDHSEKLFESCKNQTEQEAGKQFEEPSLEIIKKTMLANGITWGAKDLAVSVAKMLNQQFMQTQNAQGAKMCADILAELKPEA
ncbi:MAG: hypothetical protein SOZ34_02610 [Clostridia bacterium]|nr:hypothetical protein [Clostridia bacterium]